MVVPQLSPTAGFQQVVSQSPTISASGHGTTTTALLLTPTQDARELQITRQTQAAQPVTQIQLTASFPGKRNSITILFLIFGTLFLQIFFLECY